VAFEASQRIERPIDEVFAFFSKPENLELITPPWVGFRILTPPPIDLHEGALIDYRIRLKGIPIRWRTEITAWDPPHRFVDTQLRGPYRRWVHTHSFQELDDGTLVEDHVDYAVPGGALVDRLFVRRDVERIFAYRRAVLADRFSGV
jgi:ligand-binding SRPBCC domain-containing protein